MSMKGLNLPKEITKFLVLSDDAKYLRYVFGGLGIYIESVTPIFPKKPSRGQFQRPALLTARFAGEEQIRLLIEKVDKRLQVRRIFKSVWKRPQARDKIDGFIRNCAKNLLNLAKEKTLRIYCKDDPELQKRFYDIFLEENEKEKTNCKFDYDKYDVLFWSKSTVKKRNIGS